jgi:hypothetical protein
METTNYLYVLETNSILIVELPICNVPVVYEKQFYPHNLHGASGSVIALDLALIATNCSAEIQGGIGTRRRNHKALTKFLLAEVYYFETIVHSLNELLI